MIVTANVLVRTVELSSLRPGDKTVGTGFTIEGPDDRQYLVTARHLIDEFHLDVGSPFAASNAWTAATVPFDPLEAHAGVDVAVIRLAQDLTDRLPLTPTSDGAVYGGPVRMVGYPRGLRTVIAGQGKVGFIRQGVVAGSETHPRQRWWFDMRSNPGYSGAPVVFGHGKGLRVMAVYAGSLGQGDEDPLPGFGVGYDVKYALEAITGKS